MRFRIIFKILLLTYKCFYHVYGLAPRCLTELITKKGLSHYNLHRSHDGTLLSYPTGCTKVTVGDCSFFVAAPELKNVLPVDICRANTVDVFKSSFKAHLFKEAFGHHLHNES